MRITCEFTCTLPDTIEFCKMKKFSRQAEQAANQTTNEKSSTIIHSNVICRATGIEDDPKATLDIQCLRRGDGVALI